MISLEKKLASKALLGLDSPKIEAEQAIMRGLLYRLGLDRYSLRKRERPDFSIRVSGKVEEIVLACEVTHFYSDTTENGSVDRRFFGLWLEFAERLRARLCEQGLDHLYGAIHFNEPSRIELPPCDAFIDEILAILSDCKSLVIARFDSTKTPLLAEHVDHIFLRDTSPAKGVRWWCAHLQTGTVPYSEGALRACVANKDHTARSFTWPDCREKWLLIYAASRGLADKVVLRGPVTPPVACANFDRIFLWDKFSETIFQIHPSFGSVVESPRIYRSRLPEFLRTFVLVSQGKC